MRINKIDIKNLTMQERIQMSNTKCMHTVLSGVLGVESTITGRKFSEVENFWILSLSAEHFLVSLETIAFVAIERIRNLRSLSVFRYAILREAKYVILAHNHPISAKNPPDLLPSEADFNITDQLYHCGKSIEIPVIDHLIVTEKKYLSCDKYGMMDKVEKSPKYVITKEIAKELNKEKEKLMKNSYDKGIKIGINKGKKEGLKEGIKIGLEKGEKKGFKIGEEAGKNDGLYTKALQAARLMKKDGIDIKLISKYSGLTEEEINGL